MGTLYLVSTPIGNLGDISGRALDALRSSDRVLAEDTRRTSILLRHYGIRASLVSAHEHNEAERAEQVVAWLSDGETLALVSDAGTPLLSDPGERIVRAALDAGHVVVPVPGASALLAALVGSGLPTAPFTFYGFLPRSGGARRRSLEDIAALPHTAVLYESPNRLSALLADLSERSGGERPVVVARELTKMHEVFFRGTLTEAIAYYEKAGPVRGEVVVVLGGAPERGRVEEAVEKAVRELAAEMLRDGRRPSGVARELARRFRLPRNRAYEIALELAESSDET